MRWYRLGSVFALPSSSEPFGAVVNEALLSGIPVVCSDRAGALGLIREGETGAIVDAADSHALVAALRTWIDRARPVDGTQQEILRPSLMATTFADAIDRVFNAIGVAAAARASR